MVTGRRRRRLLAASRSALPEVPIRDHVRCIEATLAMRQRTGP